MQSVNVIGHGTLSFPDDMTQAQMAEAIQRNFPDIHPAEKSTQSDVPVFASNQGSPEAVPQQFQNAPPVEIQAASISDKAGAAASAIGRSILAVPLGVAGAVYGGIHGIGKSAEEGNFGTSKGADSAAETAAQDMQSFTAPAMSGASPLAQENMGKIGEVVGAFDPAMGMQGISHSGYLKPAQVGESIAAKVAKNAPEAGDLWRGGEPIAGQPQKLANISDIGERIKANSTENDLAPYKLENGNVIKDPHAQDAINQGWSKGSVQNLKAMDNQTTDVAKSMLDRAEQGRNNDAFKDQNSPTDLIGNALEQNIKFVKSKNKQAGANIDAAAESLKGEPLDASGPANNFISTLENKVGVKFKRDENGQLVFNKDNKLTPDFNGSDIEGDTYKPTQDFIKSTLNRMSDTSEGKTPDAYDAHRLKRTIDNTVKFGQKNNSNLHPDVEYAVKSLRHELDDALDSNFDNYNKANIQYRDTAQALGNMQDAAGNKLDLFGDGADKQLGTLSRRLMSNAASRQELNNAISGIQDTSLKYGNPNKVDINKLGSFGGTLEKMYNNSKPYSFAAQTALGAAKAAQGDIGAIVHTGGKVKDFIMRVSPEKQYKSLGAMLSRQQIKHYREKNNIQTIEPDSTEVVTQ